VIHKLIRNEVRRSSLGSGWWVQYPLIQWMFLFMG